VPFLFLSFETNILTTLRIIDIWKSTLRKKKNKSFNLKEKEVMARVPLFFNEFFSK